VSNDVRVIHQLQRPGIGESEPPVLIDDHDPFRHDLKHLPRLAVGGVTFGLGCLAL
jgi:hypothetical protein